MTKPCVRAETAAFLRERQSSIVRRVLAYIQASPELAELHEVSRTDEYRAYLTNLLDLIASHIADPSDRRCFQVVRERAMDRFRADASPVPVSRVAALHRMICTRLIRRGFRDQPQVLGRAIELIELVSAELDGTVASAYKNARDERSRTAETKYHALFENASEAILSFTPGEGKLIEVNAQCERLLGQNRLVLLRRGFADLFAEEYADQARWLAAQTGGANLRLEDMAVHRSDGSSIPVSLSCNWVDVDGVTIAQVIMRDVTPLRQIQRELQSHAEQLEARVASRTAELQNSEERYRALFLQEQRRAQHLSLINDVQQCALVTRDVDEFLHQVAAAVQLHFRECDVTFYLCREYEDAAPAGLIEAANRDETGEETVLAHASDDAPAVPEHCGDLVVAAQVGGYGMAQPIGSSHPLHLGLPGFAATNGALLVIANDALSDERYSRAPGVHRDALAQMCVPVSIEGEIAGVITVSGAQRDVFDPRDAVALQTASTIVASHLQASQMFREMAELKEFNETLVGTMLHSLMVVSRDGIVQIVNERLSQTLRAPRAELLNRPVSEILGDAFVRHDLQEALDDVTDNGSAREIPEVRIWSRGSVESGARSEEFIFDVRLSRVFFRGQAHAVFLLINLTQRWRKTQQLQLMNEMGRFLQSSLEVNTVLRTVLTCITAGPALGFNRAFLLLLSEDGTLLKGAMALGPSSQSEASVIWREMGRRALSLQEILADNSELDTEQTPLQRDIMALQVPLDAAASPALAQSVRERRALKVRREQFVAFPAVNSSLAAPGPAVADAGERPATSAAAQLRSTEALQRTRSALSQIFTAPEAVVAPLVAKTRIVGVVVADNLYSGAPVEDDDVRLLETVAQQAGLTIDNALTYQALHQAQRELVSAERLVAVGEMAARVSHEIRNPLATIGGWARSILKKPEDSEGVKRKISIITDEVSRLEELLSDLLDMARPRELLLAPCGVNELVDHAILLAEADIKAAGVEVDKQMATDIPIAMLDRRRLLQALLNTLRNGAQSMGKGGVLSVFTRYCAPTKCIEIEVRDTGAGIPERALKQIFDPFFSTKVSGSGLGLAVTLRIVRDHGGTIDVFSNEGQGTRFIMNLPLKTPPVVEETAGAVTPSAIDGQAAGADEALDAAETGEFVAQIADGPDGS